MKGTNMDQIQGQLEGTQSSTRIILQLLLGLWMGRCIHIAANLGLADLLKDGPKSVQELAQLTDTHAPSLYRLLRCFASAGIFVETEPNIFAQTEISQALRSDRPDSLYYLAKWFGQECEWKIWEDLEYSIRTGKSALEHIYGVDMYGYLNKHPDEARLFNLAIAGYSRELDKAVAHAYDFTPFSSLVDVGGGHGGLVTEILSSCLSLKGILFDKASVIESARESIDPKISPRIEYVAGDFFEKVPESGDIYILKHVINNWDDKEAITILKHCRKAMGPTSKILIADPIIQSNGGTEGKLYDLLMLLTTTGGRGRTEEEYANLYKAADFNLVRIITTEMPVICIAEGIPL